MAKKRKPLPLYEHEDRLLKERYLAWGIPIDQYEKLPADLLAFTRQWNKLSGRSDTPDEIHHYMRTRRKQKKWVRFNGKHKKQPPTVVMSAEHTEALVDIFRDVVLVLGIGSDSIAYDGKLAGMIAKEFARRTGRLVPACDLVGKLTALRRRGLLPKVGREPGEGEDGIGFADIDDVSA